MKKALWTLISQIPLVGGAAVLWKDVVKHPVAAIGLAVLYELFSFVLIFGSKVWKELEPQAVAGAAEWVKIAFLNFFSRFRRRYNRQVIYDLRVFNVRGLRTTGTYTLEVEKVFVELRIAPGHLQQAGVNPTAFKEVSGSQSNLAGLSPEKEMKFLKELTQNTTLPPPRTFALNRALDRAHLLDRALIRALSHTLVLDHVRTRDLARGLIPNFFRALDFARALDFDLVFARDRCRDFDHNPAYIIDRAQDRVRDRARDRTRELSRDLAHGLYHSLDFDLGHCLAHDFIKNINIDLISKVDKALQSNNISDALNLIEKILSVDLPIHERVWVKLISDTLYMAKANTFVEYRRASRNFAIKIFEYTYDGLKLLGKIRRPLWKPWRRFRRSMDDTEKLKQDVLDLYWFLRMVQARESGKLPAWEGIRLVREFEKE